MAIIQLSAFLENRVGSLNDILKILNDNGINIRALALADTADYGILRMIVNDCKTGIKALKDKKVSVSSTPVIAAEVADEPGGLLKIIAMLAEEGINIEYMYAFVEKSGGKAVVVLRIENVEKSEKILKEKNVRLLGEENLSSF